MQPDFYELESEWLNALQHSDGKTLDRLLDSAFVCAPWSSGSELLLRREYINQAKRAQLKSCELKVVHVQMLGNFAIVRSRIACEYSYNAKTWTLDLSIIDVWVHREDGWKALNRDTAALSALDEYERRAANRVM